MLLTLQMTVSRKKSWTVLSCSSTQSTHNQANHKPLHQQVTNPCSHPGWATPLHKSLSFRLTTATASPPCQVSSLSTPCMPLLLASGWQLCHSADVSSNQPHATYQSSAPSSPWSLAIPHGTHCSMACQVMTDKVNCCIQQVSKVNKMYVHAW
jgi:hypothetical protein